MKSTKKQFFEGPGEVSQFMLLQQLLRVVVGCVEYPDYCGEETRIQALKALLTLMRNVWPRYMYIPVFSQD